MLILNYRTDENRMEITDAENYWRSTLAGAVINSTPVGWAALYDNGVLVADWTDGLLSVKNGTLNGIDPVPIQQGGE